MTIPTQTKTDGLVWLITGASRGLGAKIAQTVLAHGNRLVATARNTSSLPYGSDQPNALAVSLDVTTGRGLKLHLREHGAENLVSPGERSPGAD